MSASISSPRRLKKSALRRMQAPFFADGDTFTSGGIEPEVDDMLRDPIIAMVMRRDRVTADEVRSLIQSSLQRP